MSWYLNPALAAFRAAVDARWPGRDRTSDGTIGDLAHQVTTSDHNPDVGGPHPASVDAWDMDIDGVDVELLKRVFQAHPASQYWIHARQIASRDDGWRRWAYDGANPHDKHVHWNTRESHEASTAPWVIGDDVDKQDIAAIASATMTAVHTAHWDDYVPDATGTRPPRTLPAMVFTTRKDVYELLGMLRRALADVDPGAGTYTLGGAVWTTMQRAGAIDERTQGIVAQLGAIVAQLGAATAEQRKAALAESTRDELLLTTVRALAANGGPETAPILAAIQTAHDDLVVRLTDRVGELEATLRAAQADVAAARIETALMHERLHAAGAALSAPTGPPG